MWKFLKDRVDMWKFIKELFGPILEDEMPKKSFNEQLCGAIDRAEKARILILNSDLPQKLRLKIGDEILYLTDDLRELETIKQMEIDKLWQYFQMSRTGPFGWY